MTKKFAITPEMVDTEVTIDYATPEGVKIFREEVKPLTSTGYNLSSEGLLAFLTKVKNRAVCQGWQSILSVPEAADVLPNEGRRDLIDHYGDVDIDQVRVHAQTYMGKETREAQNATQLYHCLMRSVSEEGLEKITL